VRAAGWAQSGGARAQFLGACITPGMTMLVTEVMEGGSLHSRLRSGAITWMRGRAPRAPSPCPARGRDATPDASGVAALRPPWLPCVRRGAARLAGPDRLMQGLLEVAVDLAQAVPWRFLACMCRAFAEGVPAVSEHYARKRARR